MDCDRAQPPRRSSECLSQLAKEHSNYHRRKLKTVDRLHFAKPEHERFHSVQWQMFSVRTGNVSSTLAT